jgi:adenylosuccinate synthase
MLEPFLVTPVSDLSQRVSPLTVDAANGVVVVVVEVVLFTVRVTTGPFPHEIRERVAITKGKRVSAFCIRTSRFIRMIFPL